MNRGDIWVVNLGGRIGTRPVLIITRQNVIKYLNKVAILEITTKGKGYPTEVFIDQQGNLSKPSFVQADNIHTIPKDRLEKYMGTLNSSLMHEISQKIVLALELENCFYED